MPRPRTRRPSRARRAVHVALGAALILLVVSGAGALGATPEPSLLVPGDPRSEGEGPGLMGSPIAVAIGVLVLGVLAAGATILVLRLTRDD